MRKQLGKDSGTTNLVGRMKNIVLDKDKIKFFAFLAAVLRGSCFIRWGESSGAAERCLQSEIE